MCVILLVYLHFNFSSFTKKETCDRAVLNRENLTLPMVPSDGNAPPIPQRESRPRSQGFNTVDAVRTPTRGSADYSSLPSMKSRYCTWFSFLNKCF